MTVSEINMNKAIWCYAEGRLGSRKDPDMLDEYDFSDGVRGKFARRYREGTNIVRLDEDVAEKFPNSEKVNEALRYLIKHPPQPYLK